MTVKRATVYYLACDRCDARFGGPRDGAVSPAATRGNAQDNGWERVDRRDLCTRCVTEYRDALRLVVRHV